MEHVAWVLALGEGGFVGGGTPLVGGAAAVVGEANIVQTPTTRMDVVGEKTLSWLSLNGFELLASARETLFRRISVS